MGFTFYKNVLLSRIAGLSSSLFCLLLVEPLELSFGDCVHGLSVLTLFLSVVHKNHTHLSPNILRAAPQHILFLSYHQRRPQPQLFSGVSTRG